MKVSNLSWKMTMIIGLGAGLLFYSCDNNDYSGKNSTTSTTDTATINNTGTAVSNDNMGVTDTLSTSSTSTARKGRRTGKIAVAPITVNKTEKMAANPSGFYNYAEVAPSYSGGQVAIENYITNNLQYPDEAIDNDIEGTVNVQIGIDENGNIISVKTIGNKIGYGLEDEAVKVVGNMPKWNAGMVKGKKVKTYMVLPITYRLEE